MIISLGGGDCGECGVKRGRGGGVVGATVFGRTWFRLRM